MEAQAAPTQDDLRFFEIEQICERANGRSRRQVHRDMKQPGCPLVLRWIGKRKACDAATLRAYLAWIWERAELQAGG